jgi:four helix bundle protein
LSDYKQLKVWEKAHQVTLDVYQVSARFPKEEIYGLTSQMRRATVSIPANIAEGSGRGSNAELIRFLRIATGSAFEMEYHLLLAHDLKFIEANEYQQLDRDISEIKKMLTGLIQHLESRTR